MDPKAEIAGATHGVGLEFVEWYDDFPTKVAYPRSYVFEEGVTIGMDVLYYGHTLGTFHTVLRTWS